MWRSTAGFAVGLLLLDAVSNTRFPGPEPPFWYLVPCLDVLALIGLYTVFSVRRRTVPTAVHVVVIAALLLIRLVRLGDGVSARFFDRSFNLYIQLPLVPELGRLAHDSMTSREILMVSSLAGGALVAGSVAAWYALRHVADHLATPEGRKSAGAVVGVLVVAAMLVSKPENGAGFFGLLASSGLERLGREALFLARLPSLRRQCLTRIDAVRRAITSRPHDLRRLERNHVILFIVESYGEIAVRSPVQRAILAPAYEAFERELGARGFHIASSVLTAPTFGVAVCAIQRGA
jgi:hypothetical protein